MKKILFTLSLLLVGTSVFAWAEPTNAPPGPPGNVTAPLRSPIGTGVSLTDGGYFLGAPTYGFRFNNNANTFNNLIIRENGNAYIRGQLEVGSQAVLGSDASNINVGDLASGDGQRNLILRAGDQDRITIQNTGNVGIGTAAPTSKLHIIGAGATNIDLYVNGRMRSDNADGGLWIQSDRFVGGAGAGNIGFYNNGAWRLTVGSTGGVTIPGSLTVSGQAVCLANGTNCPAQSGTVSGSGTANSIPKWTGASSLGNSNFVEDGQSLGSSNVRGGIVGVYDPSNTQNVWTMGTAYKLPEGGASSNYGNFYGLGWSYEPNYGGAGNNPQSRAGLSHQLLLMMAGQTYTALGNGIWTSGLTTSYNGFSGDASANIAGTGAAAYLPNGFYNPGASSWNYGTRYISGAEYDVNYGYVYNGGTLYGRPEGNAGAAICVGNDTCLHDVNTANTLAVIGNQSPVEGRINLGNNGYASIAGLSGFSGQELHLNSASFIRFNPGGGGSGSYRIGSGSVGIESVTPVSIAVLAEAQSTNSTAVNARATASGGTGVSGYGMLYDFNAVGPGTNYGTGSSIRWKRNIEQIPNALEKLSQIRGVYFDWDEEHGGQHDVGFIAEEVGKVLPEIVVYEENGVDANGMDYSKITPLLLESIKELKAENDDLKARIEALEAKLK